MSFDPSKCLPGKNKGYDKISEQQGFASGTTSYTIDGATGYQNNSDMDTVQMEGGYGQNSGTELPPIGPQSSEFPSTQPRPIGSMGGSTSFNTASVFASCCPGSSGITGNTILNVLICAAQIGASMAIGSTVLLADFFRRLSCAFFLIYDMEALQMEEECAGSQVDTRSIAHRGNLLSKALIGVYLLSASFFMATFALWRMYGHDPPEMSSAGWLILFGVFGVALDVLHVFNGVKQSLVHDDIELARFWWCYLQVYGSLFVLIEGLIASMNGGRYLDPIMCLFYAATMAVANMGPVMSACSEIYNRVRA